MKEADEYQPNTLKKVIGIILVTIALSIGLFMKPVAADKTEPLQPVELVAEPRQDLPQGKRHQFRAKLLRNWWQVRQPKYVIYRSLFQKS